MKIIIYGSQYGTSQKYAEELSRRTGIDAISHKNITDINQYDTIVYIGGVYAGSVLGMKKTFGKLSQCQGKKILIATVGLSDPTDAGNTENIKNGIKAQLSPVLYENAQIFHLRGGIDYSRLSFIHKMIMGMLYKNALKMPEDQRTADINVMVETYNKKADFMDFERLTPLIDLI